MSVDSTMPARSSLFDKGAAWIDNYHPQLRLHERGRIVSVGDGIAWISGLPSAAIDCKV